MSSTDIEYNAVSSESDEKQRRLIRAAVSIVFSFFLSLFLIVLSIAAVLSMTFMSSDFLQARINGSAYVSILAEAFEDDLVSYGLASGFEEAFMISVLNKELMASDVKQGAARIYDSSAKAVDLTVFENELYAKLESEAAGMGIEITDEVRTALEYMVEICSDAYENHIKISASERIGLLVSMLEKPLLIAYAVLLVFSALCIVLLCYIHQKKQMSLRYIQYSLTGAAITLFIPSFVLWISGIVRRIGIEPKSTYYLINDYFDHLVYRIFTVTAILLVLIAVCAAIRVFLTKKRGRESI